jgi:hypothetical protein
MCEERPATMEFFAPVCAECHAWLTDLEGELDSMEKTDPALGKAAGEIADAWRQLNG